MAPNKNEICENEIVEKLLTNRPHRGKWLVVWSKPQVEGHIQVPRRKTFIKPLFIRASWSKTDVLGLIKNKEITVKKLH
jgi:hypothetical protein